MAALVTLALIVAVQHGALRSAQAQTFPTVGDDVFYTSYYDVATSIAPSAAGYGGSGFSGGAGDGTVRIVNPTANDTIQFGTLCAMIYVFDDIEELQVCCGCPVTQDGMRTYSVINDLTNNFGVSKGNLNAGVIDVISATLNFTPAPNIQPPNGINLAGRAGKGCDPTGGGLNGEDRGVGNSIIPTSALRVWMTHTETAGPSFVNGVSVEGFATAPLDNTHLDNLQSRCGLLLRKGSSPGSGSVGSCSCGFGDD